MLKQQHNTLVEKHNRAPLRALTHQANGRPSSNVWLLGECLLFLLCVPHLGSSLAYAGGSLSDSTSDSRWDRLLRLAVVEFSKEIKTERNLRSTTCIFSQHHEPPGMKKLISMIDIPNGKQALLCLQFVYLQS